MENIFKITNLVLNDKDTFIIVSNFFDNGGNDIYNYPFSGYVSSYIGVKDVGVWKIKQLKK